MIHGEREGKEEREMGWGWGWGVGTGKGKGKENVVPVCSLARKKAGRPAGLLHHRERALVSSRRLRLPQKSFHK